MNARTIIGCVGTAIAASTVSLAAPPEASFQGIGVLPGGTGSGALGVSGDGQTVVGWSAHRDGTLEAIKWSPTPNDNAGQSRRPNEEAIGVGLCGLGRLMGTFGGADPMSEAHGVSFDGSVIVGMSTSHYGIEAFRWTPLTGMEGLGDLPSDNTAFSSIAYAVSDDGRTVVGSGGGVFCDVQGEAFVWTPESGMVGLGMLPAGRLVSSAQGISGDGSMIVGWGKTDLGIQTGKWIIGHGFVELGDLPGGKFDSRAYAVSGDGSTIVGAGAQMHDQQPVAWYRGGTIVDLGSLPAGSLSGEALGASADGSIIVGVMYTDQGDEAFVWDASNGVRAVTSLLADGFWLDLGGWTLTRATGVSANGMIIAGEGISPEGRQEGWVASIRCAADYNGDFVADIQDFLAFHDLAKQGSPDADCTGDGVVNISDYVCFFKLVQAGCP